jgi:ssRNA-specific RNase YbeY (16S rRNA maturation enzyme)
MTRLLVHGLLHLVGHEHDSTAGRRRMRAAEAAHIAALRPWVRELRTRYRVKAGR